MNPEFQRLVAGQHGAFLLRQAQAYYSEKAIRYQVQTGNWSRIVRGAYLESEFADDPWARASGVQLLYGGRVVISHESAAELLGFGVLKPKAVHVTAVTGDDIVGREGVVIHTSALPMHSIVRSGGLVIASAERTVVDIARLRRPRDGLAVADAALRCGAARDLMSLEVKRAKGFAGVVKGRWVVKWADPRPESPQESRVRAECLAAGLPSPEIQLSVCDQYGVEIYRLDLGWREYMLGVEYDGRQFHLHDVEGFRKDRQRQNHLQSMGWEILRFTDVDLWPTGRAMVATVAGALVRRGWSPLAA